MDFGTYRPEFHRHLLLSRTVVDTDTVEVEEEFYKYPARSLILSLAIPGAGQWYAGSKMKALMFAAFEVGSWAAWYHMKHRGKDLRIDFEKYANLHWSLVDWVSYSEILREYKPDIYGDVDILGTHHLWIILADGSRLPSDTLASGEIDPQDVQVQKDSEFYENIGKYDQFVAGWDDTGLSHGDTLWWDYKKDVGESIETIVMTKHREKYLNMREDHNIALKWAGYAVSAIMFNHVISALEAAWETRKQSHKQKKVETSLGLLYSPYSRFGVGGIRLSLSW